ncbi:MAG: tripartite tricarboxylate transporter permease [Candidatus Nanoarchaeia archaeon]
MLYILLALLTGIIAGCITGLIPGLHINLITILLISLYLTFSPITLIIFITSMAITHTFLNFIPAILLGAPETDTALSIMPGHHFLLKGKAQEAILLTLKGSLIAILLLTIIIPIFLITIPLTYQFIERMMSFFLIWICIFLIYNEKPLLPALIIFITAGFLGIATLNIQVNQPLLPLLTGLFGTSTLLYSISSYQNIPKQEINKIKINKKQLIKPTIATAIISPICSFFPGLGSSQAAIISSSIIKLNKKQFLILLGSINTLVMSVSFLTLYLIGKSRTGAAAAIQQIIQLSPSTLSYILLTIIISSIIAYLLACKISIIFTKNIHKYNYRLISTIIILLLTISTLLISNLIGMLILITSTLLGLTCIYLNVRRSLLMASLLIPTILFYLP